MDIIIIGYGKAGVFHRNAYMELREEGIFKGKLYFVDIKGNDKKDNSDEKVYERLELLLEENQIDPAQTIIDICLPIGSMLDTIQQSKEYGFYHFICEKPFVLYKEPNINAKEVLSEINMYIVENYMYSQITCFAKEMVSKYDLNAKIVTSDFSKDRREDSFNNRAFVSEGSHLSVFEVEVPHQLYMCEHLFGKVSRIVYKQCEDMVVEDKCMKEHGRGAIICTNDSGGVYIINSNLQREMKRNIHAIFEDKYVMDLYFSPVNTEKLSCNYCGVLYKDGQLIESKIVDRDNNMYEMLKDYYLGFMGERDKKFVTYEELLLTSNLFQKIKNEENYIHSFDIEESIYSRNIYYDLHESSLDTGR